MGSQTGNDELHPLDEMVEFLKVQLKAQEERRQKEEKRRQIEFALHQITLQLCNRNNMIVVNGCWDYSKEDGRVAMRIITSFLRGSTFEMTQNSVNDIFINWKYNYPDEWDLFQAMEECLRKQKELLFHLLGRVPQVIETKRLISCPSYSSFVESKTQEMVVSAVFSYD